MSYHHSLQEFYCLVISGDLSVTNFYVLISDRREGETVEVSQMPDELENKGYHREQLGITHSADALADDRLL